MQKQNDYLYEKLTKISKTKTQISCLNHAKFIQKQIRKSVSNFCKENSPKKMGITTTQSIPKIQPSEMMPVESRRESKEEMPYKELEEQKVNSRTNMTF